MPVEVPTPEDVTTAVQAASESAADRFYSREEIDALLALKSDVGHEHKDDPTPPPDPEPEPEPTDLLFSDDFESGDFDRWTTIATNGGAGAAITQDRVRNGRYAARLYVNANGSNSGVRLSWKNHLNASERDDFNLPPHAFYSAWYYIPEPVDVDWWLLSEIKQQQGGTSHPLYVVIQNSQGRIQVDSRVRADGSIASNIVRSWTLDEEFPVREWFRLGLEYKVDEGLDGIVGVRLNDEEIFRADGLRTHADWDHSSYAQQWIAASYGRTHSPARHDLFVDDVTVEALG